MDYQREVSHRTLFHSSKQSYFMIPPVYLKSSSQEQLILRCQVTNHYQLYQQNISMGPVNSKQNSLSEEKITISHPYFMGVEKITHDAKQFLKIKMLVDGQRTIKKWEDSQKRLQKMDTQPLFFAVDHKFVEQGFCGSAGLLEIIYENYPHILKDEIKNRNQVEESFQETEVWYLLHILICSALQFHTTDSKLGDIRPQNIFINKDGQIKLANVLSWPRQENNYLKSLHDKQVTYLSPEEMQQLSLHNPNPIINFKKSQSFSIGLTLLDAVLLTDNSSLYNFSNCTFNSKELQNQIQKMQKEKKYSQFLLETIKQLLHLDVDTRKSSEQIYEKIKPFQHYIKNLINFKPPVPISNFGGSQTALTSPFIHSNINTYNFSNNPIQPNFSQSYYENKYDYSSNLPLYSPNKATVLSTPANYSPVTPNQNTIFQGNQQNQISTSAFSISHPPLPSLNVPLKKYDSITSNQSNGVGYLSNFSAGQSNTGKNFSNTINSLPVNSNLNAPYRTDSNNFNNTSNSQQNGSQKIGFGMPVNGQLKATTMYSAYNTTPVIASSEPKMSIWDDIDKQIQRSRQLYS